MTQDAILPRFHMEDIEREKLNFERVKLQVDVVKHISTLATGTIVLTATLLDKIPKPVFGGGWILASMICMLVSLAMCALYLAVSWVPSKESQGRLFHRMFLFILIVFMGGVACLAEVVARNVL